MPERLIFVTRGNVTFVLGMVFFNFVTSGMLHIRLGEKQGWGEGGDPGEKI